MTQIQNVIATAIGGHAAGMVFEGDRRFPIVVRLTDAARDNIDLLRNLPVPLPAAGSDGHAMTIPLREVVTFSFSEGPNQISRENGKRRIVVQANVRGRDIGSLVAEAQEKIGARVTLPAGYWVEWGGQFENLVAAQARLAIVVIGGLITATVLTLIVLLTLLLRFTGQQEVRADKAPMPRPALSP